MVVIRLLYTENPFQINELKHGGAFYAVNVQTGGLITSRMQENEELQ